MPGGIHPTLEVIASWPRPNYVNPERKGWGLVITTIVLFTLALFTVLARLWARFVLLRNPGLDDLVIVLAMVRQPKQQLRTSD